MPFERSATPDPASLPASFPSLGKAPAFCARLSLELEKKLRLLGCLPGSTLLLAVSGGADSTALACLTSLLRERMGLKLFMLTCDHGLRAESAAEARFVTALGNLLGMETVAVNLVLDAAKPGIEERARAARHQAFAAAREKTGADWTVLAHHAGDLREDMILRLLRGTGWPALGGMPERDPERRLLRPLLDVEPAELRQALEALGMPHCEDPSNQDTRLARNRVRLELMPRLEEENTNLGQSLLSLARLARVDAAYFDELAGAALKDCQVLPSDAGDTLFVPLEVLERTPQAVRLRLYMAALHTLLRQGAKGQARAETLFRLDMAVQERRWPRTFQLPGDLEAELTSKGLTLRPKKREEGN